MSVRMPGVDQIGELMRTWARDWATKEHLLDCYTTIEGSVREHLEYGHHSRAPALNFERLLGEMSALSHWMEPAPFGAILREVVCNGAAPVDFDFPNADAYGPKNNIDAQLLYLLDRLAKQIRAETLAIDRSTPAFNDYTLLISTLRERFDVGVYNLNYDNIALSAWPGAHVGFDASGAFSPSSVYDRQAWDFIYHLHGSVHHCLIGSVGRDIEWRCKLGGEFKDSDPGSVTDRYSEDKNLPKSTLIAGGFKLDQLLVEPFHSLHAAFVRHVYEADAILFGGYGFGDAHVNRALRNRLECRPCEQRPPIMILDRAAEPTEALRFRQDRWAWELQTTLSVDQWFFAEAGQPNPANPSDLVARGGFELAPIHCTAVWYAGFHAAAARAQDIACWLDDGDARRLQATHAAV